MWTCPKCKHKFYNKNQSHSCGNYSVEDYVKAKPKEMIELLDYFLKEYKKIGDFELHPVKTRIALLTQMRFCSINKLGKNFVDIHFVLTEPFNENTCFYRIENLGDRFFVHHLRLYEPKDLDAEVRKFMKLAYDIGNRKHVAIKKQPGKS